MVNFYFYEETLKFVKDKFKGIMYGDKPYTYHLKQVELETTKIIRKDWDWYGPLLSNFQISQISSAALLHDYLEDIPGARFQELVDEFDFEVARLVYAVTKPKGCTRKEQIEKYYPRILAGGEKAIAIKLADRICNVRECIATNNRKLFSMYKREHINFQAWFRYRERDVDLFPKTWKEYEELIKNG